MDDPLLTWIKLFCQNGENLDFSSSKSLSDGVLLHDILRLIDEQPADKDLIRTPQNQVQRLWNMFLVYRRIERFNTNTLQQIVMLPPPNLIKATLPTDPDFLENLQGVLLLVFGCASLCSRKDEFIQQMENALSESHQDSLTQKFSELAQNTLTLGEPALDPNSFTYTLFQHLKRVCLDRSRLYQEMLHLYMKNESELSELHSVTYSDLQRVSEEKSTLAVKFEALQKKCETQQLDVEEAKKRLDEKVKLVTELQRQLADKSTNSKPAESPSNEESTAAEVYRLRQQLTEMHFYRDRVLVVRNENSSLIEEKQNLEVLLANSRKKEEAVFERLVECQMKLDELQAEREQDRRKVTELLEAKRRLENDLNQMQQQQQQGGVQPAAVGSGAADVAAAKREALIKNLQRRLTEMEREVEGLKTRLMEAQKLSEQKEDKWKFLDMQKEKLEVRREATKLREQLNGEKERSREVESKNEMLQRERDMLQAELQNLQTNYEAHTQEMEAKIGELSKQVLLLRRKGAKLANVQQFRELELAEKELMYQSMQELSTQVSKLKHHNNILRQSCDKLKLEVDKILAIEEENERVQRENRELRRNVTSHTTNDTENDELRRRNLLLEVENKKLRKIMETLVKIDPHNKFHYITSL